MFDDEKKLSSPRMRSPSSSHPQNVCFFRLLLLTTLLQEVSAEPPETKRKCHESLVTTIPSTTEISLVDPICEQLDPTPDVRTLFGEFDKQFFKGALASVEVRWSPRMTLCAGMCVYEGKGGLCSVRLSEALLKFRPRSDLVETLLVAYVSAVFVLFLA